MKNTQKAVTLVELITAIAIVAIVASVSFATYNKTAEKNRLDRSANLLRSLLDAARAYELHHPQSLTENTRDDSTWKNSWKLYLKNYVATISEATSTKTRLDYLRTTGRNPIEYYMNVDNGRKFMAWDVTSGRLQFIDWNGNLTRATGTAARDSSAVIGIGKRCITNSDCDNGCITAKCVYVGAGISACRTPYAQPDNTSCGTIGSGQTCHSGVCNCDDGNICTTDTLSNGRCNHSNVPNHPVVACGDNKMCENGGCVVFRPSRRPPF